VACAMLALQLTSGPVGLLNFTRIPLGEDDTMKALISSIAAIAFLAVSAPALAANTAAVPAPAAAATAPAAAVTAPADTATAPKTATKVEKHHHKHHHKTACSAPSSLDTRLRYAATRSVKLSRARDGLTKPSFSTSHSAL
jgi:hypothetical protein